MCGSDCEVQFFERGEFWYGHGAFVMRAQAELEREYFEREVAPDNVTLWRVYFRACLWVCRVCGHE